MCLAGSGIIFFQGKDSLSCWGPGVEVQSQKVVRVNSLVKMSGILTGEIPAIVLTSHKLNKVLTGKVCALCTFPILRSSPAQLNHLSKPIREWQ